MDQIEAERATPRTKAAIDAARRRIAVETYAQSETTLRRTARRYSLCADDADEALQRSLEILLRKAPSDDPLELVKWMQTVVKHEALGVRRERERILAGPAATSGHDGEDWVALLPAGADGPAEQVERREEIARSREALQALKPQELRALTLFGEGYSYAEIGEITNWSHTKINRCLAEGRERFRRLIARGEAGERCADLRPLLSTFCDGEARPEEVAELREHLRACAHCRATLRAYRRAPKAAAALAPLLPLHRTLWERVQEAASGLANRLPGGEGASQLAAGGGASGGTVAFVKLAAICIGAAGGAAACVAGGLVPGPLGSGDAPERPRLERRLADAPGGEAQTPQVSYEPAEPDPKPAPEPKPHQKPASHEPVETEPAASEPVPLESAPVESAPISEPAPAPPPVESGGGSPAGEFGP
ncbi:MAG TPA: zf-HC2 domain-containing protein [Solirubrobacterales bacterium]|nr:zf-HC2 domain-containing protein [Solirubrobacterales bacterium]